MKSGWHYSIFVAKWRANRWVRFLGETEGAAQSRRGDTRLLEIDAVMLRVQRTYGVPFGVRDVLLS